MSSCSAWRYRPTSASARPDASTRTSRGASSDGVHGASSGAHEVICVLTSPGEKMKTGIRPSSCFARISPKRHTAALDAEYAVFAEPRVHPELHELPDRVA